jgi:hypothetical protein
MRVHQSLAAAFPDWPIYGGRFPMEPHVTLAEFLEADVHAQILAKLDREAGALLPVDCRAAMVHLIEQSADGRWSQRWSFALR